MKFIFITLLTIFSLAAAAQKRVPASNGEVDFENFAYRTVSLNKSDNKITPGFFISDILVLDYRFDSSMLGFMQTNFPNNKNRLKLKNGTTQDIRSYLLSSINSSNLTTDTSAYQLICIIKKLLLSDEIYTSETDQNYTDKTNDTKKSGIKLQLDFFVKKKEDYIPLYDFDSTITGAATVRKSSAYYLQHSLFTSLQKLNSFSPEKIKTLRGKYNWDEIEQYYLKRFTVPILEETPQKGVFLSLEEFRKNAPSITKYEIIAGKKTDELYCYDDSGKAILLRNVFGYSDGENTFIESSGNFFKLIKTNHTFNLYGAKSFRKSGHKKKPPYVPLLGVGLATGVIIVEDRSGAKYNLKLSPYQLDLETGIIY